MQSNKFFILSVLISIFTLSSGCKSEITPVIKLYEGTEKSLSEIAVLECSYKRIQIESSDSMLSISGTTHLLPGEYTVYLSSKEPWKGRKFWPKAGHKYELAVYSYSMITVRNPSTAIWGIYDKTDKRWVVQ